MKKFIILIILIPGILLAQEAPQFLYLDNPVYDYLDYAINSGIVRPDFVFHQPYDKSIFDNSDLNSRVANYFKSYWRKFYGENHLSAQLHLEDRVQKNDAIFNRYRAAGSLYFNGPFFSFANRTIVDQDYKVDPLYAGDLSEADSWLFGRVNDAYAHVNFKNFDLFYGRIHRNWGPVGSPSLILSDNPYTYDHLLFSYTYKKLRLSVICARLEDLNALVLDSPDSTARMIKGTRKFMIGHRLDLAFSHKFQVAVTEMAIYGGLNRDFELRYLNPLNFYYGLQRNDKLPMSGLWSLDVFYKPHPRITLYLQGLLDDVIVNNDPGVDDRARFPDRLGMYVSARTGDLLLQGLNTDLSYVRIWNRTYQSRVTYENYHFRGLGLGYPCASCEEIKIRLDYWDIFPFVVNMQAVYGRYGAVALTDVFPLKKEEFPVEPVTENMSGMLKLTWFAYPSLSATATLNYNDEKNFYGNRINPYSGLSISLGVQVFLATGFEL
jgi:hypothetical protein